MARHRQIDIEYKGNKLRVEFDYIKGKGFINRDIPPEEDEINIRSIETLDRSEIPEDDLGTIWDIEQLVKEKIA